MINNISFSKRLQDLTVPTHSQVFNIVQNMVNEGVSLNDTAVFDRNIISEMFSAYYHEYEIAVYEDDGTLVSFEENELLLPLPERASGIFEELKWIMDKGYDINAHVDLKYNPANKFLDYPATRVFAFPVDAFMAQWLIDNGGKMQLNTDTGNNVALADWCFDNLDIISEDFMNARFDATPLFCLTTDVVRLLIDCGCKIKEGFNISIDNEKTIRLADLQLLYR